METRKRPHAEENDVLHPKKRAALDSNGSPSHINGVVHQDEPKDGDALELFRKEAIFRRMRHYSRENERSQSRIAELERRKDTCEAGMVAMEACWTQLINVIRSFVKPEDMPPMDAETRDIFDMAKHVSSDSEEAPELTEALRSRLDVTEQLVSAFVQMSGKSTGREDLYSEYQRAQTECTALRSEMALMRSQLSETALHKDQYLFDLVAAESRIDRLQSKALPTTTYHSPKVDVEQDQEDATEVIKEEEEEVKREKPSSPSLDQIQSSVQASADHEALAILIKSHEEENARLRLSVETLQDQVLIFEKQQIAPSEEFISKSPYYKIVLDHASKLEHKVIANEEELQKVRNELDVLHMSHKDFEDSVRVAKDYEMNEVTMRLKKRDGDNVRLREHRDQLLAELTERKHTESVKLNSIHELKTLAESRSERILILQSELKRLRAQLAVETRDEDLMKFILNMSSDESSYVDDLRSRLTASEARVAGLEESLSKLRKEHPDVAQHIEAEAEARQQLFEATKRLESYQNVYGQTSSLPTDVQALSEQLEKKEQELEKLRLQDIRHNEAETALYTELDKLSTAWEALDRQVKGKVFDLTAMEERLTKSALDKAKSENKFYSAMRDKEAIENERKNLTRNVDKQAKVVEKLLASERSLQSQVSDRDKSIFLMQKSKDLHLEKLDLVTSEKTDWQTRAEGEGKRVSDLGQKWSEQTRLCERLKAELAKLESALTKSNKEVEKQVKLKATQSAPSSVKEAQLQGEVNKCMSILKCSTCKLNMRTTVITKCMHTFCKQCVDARISTRQRKCPACNLAFAQSDVQQLYFQ